MKDTRSRIAEEEAAVLSGKTRNKDEAAVRWKDLPAAVAKIAESVMRTKDAVVARVPRLESFRFAGELAAGFYSWATEKTSFPPPVGRAGGALWMPRNEEGIGTIIASATSGSENRPRIFAASTSGKADDWSRWFEFLTMSGVLQPVSFESRYPAGGIFETIDGGANGMAYRFASGLQVCVNHELPPFTFNSADTLRVLWTFPAPFLAAPRPVVLPIIPSVVSSSHVDVDPVSIGHGYANMTDPLSAFVALRRSHGAPAFVSTSSVSGGAAIALGLWGAP